jgi:YidC/Oxa1 family membrane protein insertase
MGIIAVPLGYVLTWIYDLVGNYGVSLIILTVLVKCLLYPLYFKQIKSTAAMQSVQPKMMEIQEKYKNDAEKMNEEMAKLYKEENFNPFGGCLPMLIQFPIIMGLFALLRNPMKYMRSEDMLFACHESFLWIKDLGQPDLWILPIAAALATFFSFTMTQQLTTTEGEMNKQMNSMNTIMKYIFPLSILWLARSYPAGLSIYWAGGQFLQIFFNIRMNKYRQKLKEEKDLEDKRRRAEKKLVKMKRARLAKVKGK